MAKNNPEIQFSVQHPSLITEENAKAWYRYLAPKLTELVTPESMNTPEFQAILAEVAEEEKRAHLKEQHKSHCAQLPRPKINYIPEGDMHDMEVEYTTLIQEQIHFAPADRDEYLKQLFLLERWGRKSVPQIMELNRPDAAYAIALTLCRNLPEFLQNEELQAYHATVKPRLRKIIHTAYEQLSKSTALLNDKSKRNFTYRFIQEQAPQYKDFRGLPKQIQALLPAKKNTIIPINDKYEKKFFSVDYTIFGFNKLWMDMLKETGRLCGMLREEKYQKASMLYMQLVKSYCKHHTEDQYFMNIDFLFDPDEILSSTTAYFNEFILDGKIPEETMNFLRQAWKEIQSMESYKVDGIPTEDLLV